MLHKLFPKLDTRLLESMKQENNSLRLNYKSNYDIHVFKVSRGRMPVSLFYYYNAYFY